MAVLAVVTVGITALATYATAITKAKKEIRGQYDLDLRSKRIEAYGGLWHELFLLRDPRSLSQTITYQDIQTLLGRLTTWYYQESGMFLSEKSRNLFFGLLDQISDALKGDHKSDEI